VDDSPLWYITKLKEKKHPELNLPQLQNVGQNWMDITLGNPLYNSMLIQKTKVIA
jgi:hypothetical protein